MRIAVFLFALVTSASLLPAVAHAQPPAQLSPPAEPATGSISGHIVVVGVQPECVVSDINFFCALFLLPANINQPTDLSAYSDFIVRHISLPAADVNFSFSGLAGGEYFIFSWEGTVEGGTLPLENVSIANGTGASSYTRPALRVTVANGQAVTGIEVVVRAPEYAASRPMGPGSDGGVTGEDCPQPLSPPNGLSPPSDLPFVCPPTTGAAPGGAAGAPARITAGLAVGAATRVAIEGIRAGKGPAFIEAKTFRFQGHSMADPVKYRDSAETASWEARDPIVTFPRDLLAQEIMDEAELEQIRADVEAQVAEAVKFAENSPFPPDEELHTDIYA